MFNAFLPLVSLAKTLTGVALSRQLLETLRVQSSKRTAIFLTQFGFGHSQYNYTSKSKGKYPVAERQILVESVVFITVIFQLSVDEATGIDKDQHLSHLPDDDCNQCADGRTGDVEPLGLRNNRQQQT